MDIENGEQVILTTDEAILDSIGEGNEPSTDEATATETETTEGGTENTPPAVSSEQGTDEGITGESPKQVAGPQDLVDAKGDIIATGGKERRFYETAQREKGRADKATQDLATANASLEAINNAGTVGTQYNLSPEEVVTGAQLIAAYKDNPVAAIKSMLTQAQSSGYNVDELISGATDMGAVKLMLDNALAPLVGKQKQEADTQAATDQATEVYNTFSTTYPDAAVHEDSLARLLKQEPNLSLEAAYFKLQNYYLSNSLDWTKSLATLQADQDTAPATASVNTPPQPPQGGIPNVNVTDTAQVADVNTSTDDIIRQAMADAGIN